MTMKTAVPILSVAMVALAVACTPQGDPAIASNGFTESFEGPTLADYWNNTGGPYEISGGMLHVKGARNKPLWLRRTLPHDVTVELDVRSESPEGDIKVELFGDGVSRAESVSYTATSYVVIFGGWGNSLNVLARMDEHAKDRVVGPTHRVVPGRTYHMKIVREGGRLTAWADDHELATMNDPDPLYGRGHDHFGVNNWQSDVWLDNLKITPR
jgi:hypothetical protein